MDYKKLREEHENFFTTISGSKDRYRDFLNSMAYHYRQPVTAQVAIFLHGAAAHRAYATEALWKRLGAEVKKTAAGIDALTAQEGEQEKLYDVSETTYLDTHNRAELLWDYDPATDEALLKKAREDWNSQDKAIEDLLLDTIAKLAEERFSKYEESHRELIALSASYLVLSRLGLDAETAVGLPLILNEYDLELETESGEALLQEVDTLSKDVLDPIAAMIRTDRRQKAAERLTAAATEEVVQLEPTVEVPTAPTDEIQPEPTVEAPTATTDEVQPDDLIDMVRHPESIDLSKINYTANCKNVTGKRAVFRRNLAAILTLKRLEQQQKTPSEEERKLLASYSGFGGLSEVFDPLNEHWKNEYKILSTVLTNEEYTSARRTILDAYYTPSEVARAIYDGLAQIGFQGGNILEPSCGAGVFIGSMPENMKENSYIQGIELDGLSARIASYAQHAEHVRINQQSFETHRFANGSFDLAVGNVPFGNTRVYNDPKYATDGYLIHDYFLLKMVDAVRPGGLVAAITSSGTMDKASKRAREALYLKAELVIAMRLPTTTFEGTGASVTTDILIFKKREKALVHEEEIKKWKWVQPDENFDWTVAESSYSKFLDKYGITMSISSSLFLNRCFLTKKEYFGKKIAFGSILGTLQIRKGRHGDEFYVAEGKENLGNAIRHRFQEIGGKIYTPLEEPLPIPYQSETPKQRDMGFFIEGGDLIFVDTDGKVQVPELDEKSKQRVISAVHLRDAGHEVLERQIKGAPDTEIREAQELLGDLYDAHIKRYGHFLQDKKFCKAFEEDPGYCFVLALEITDEKGIFQRKADMFTERTILPDMDIEHAESAKDALIISMQEKGEIDLSYMEKLTGLSQENIISELEYQHIFYDEDKKEYIQSSEYLSGDIRAKIERQEEILEDIIRQSNAFIVKKFFDNKNILPTKNRQAKHQARRIPEPTNLLEKRLFPIVYTDFWYWSLDPVSSDYKPTASISSSEKADLKLLTKDKVIRDILKGVDINMHPEYRSSIADIIVECMQKKDGGSYENLLPPALQNDIALGFELYLREGEEIFNSSQSFSEDTDTGFINGLYPAKYIPVIYARATGYDLKWTPDLSSQKNTYGNVEYSNYFKEALENPKTRAGAIYTIQFFQKRFLQSHKLSADYRAYYASQPGEYTPKLREVLNRVVDFEDCARDLRSHLSTFQEVIVNQDEEMRALLHRQIRAEKNLEALKDVQPKDLAIGDIALSLGSPWLGNFPYIIDRYFQKTMRMSLRRVFRSFEYNPMSCQWIVEKEQGWKALYSSSIEDYSTEKRHALDIFIDCLNQKNVTPKKGNTKDSNEIDYEELGQIKLKQQELNDGFRKFILEEPRYIKEITQYYNRHFNNMRPRKYDGSSLTFRGMNSVIRLMPHQKDAIAHHLFGGNALFAHCVGAGKTFEMIASIMESKRMGISHKAMVVVPNSLVGQMGKDFAYLYPRSKILVSTEKNFEKGKIEKFISRIATQNWDAVILSESQFERIKLSRGRESALLFKEIDKLRDHLAKLRAESAYENRVSIRDTEKILKSYEAKLEKINEKNRKNTIHTITFEELGVDKLVVDEAHMYKNLAVMTRYKNYGGVGNTDFVKKTWDMYAKCQYINSITNEKGLIFATGTPVSNSLTEFHTMLRYLAPSILEKQGISHFDSFVGNFVEISTDWELKPEGDGYQMKSNLSSFKNFPELKNIYTMVADIRTADMIKGINVPKANFIVDTAKMSDQQKELMLTLSLRGEAIRKGRPEFIEAEDGRKIVDSFLKIVSDGKKISLEERLLTKEAADNPNSKVNRCVKNVMQTYKESEKEQGTQIIFCDESTSTGKGKGKFNIYDDLRSKLIAQGIPKEEIAIIQECKKDQLEKKIFGPMREGKIRILIGNTQSLGTGVNVQKRLKATHDLSIPWRPSDLEQRNGRILRPGNKNTEVNIYRYITEGTTDAWQWQKLENKQKAFAQAMSSENPARFIKNIDSIAISYADIKAAATGNPYLKEKMTLENDLSRIQRARRDHENKREEMRKYLQVGGKTESKAIETTIAALMEDKITMAEHSHIDLDGQVSFSIKIGDEVITDKKQAGEKIAKAAQEGISGIKDFQAEFQGLKLRILLDQQNMQPYLSLQGRRIHKIAIAANPKRTAQSLLSVLPAIDKRIESAREDMEKITKKMQEMKEVIEIPFPHEAEEKEKKTRLAEIEKLMKMGKAEQEDRIAYKDTTRQELPDNIIPIKALTKAKPAPVQAAVR